MIDETMNGYPRFEAYMPVLCSATLPGRPHPRRIAGKTRCVSVGGLSILLPEPLPVRNPVSVRIWSGDPLPGVIVWVGEGTTTDQVKTIPHGVAFEKLVDPELVRQWVSQAKPHPQARVAVRFDIEYTQVGRMDEGTCLNLSRGGMFIATPRPAQPGTEIVLHFALPGLANPVSVLGQVKWVCGERANPSTASGMGVQFIDPAPSEATLIRIVVDSLCKEAAESIDSLEYFVPAP